MDNLVSFVLYVCPEQDELNHVTDLQQLTFAEIKLGRYFYHLWIWVLYQDSLKGYVSAERMDFTLFTEDLTMKTWTEDWKGG